MPPMTQPVSRLRERRRQQTAREIQDAALRLVQIHGLGEVTTGMIAAEADISLRTFFNYYPNKEAALTGPPPRFDAEGIARFISSDGPLTADFATLVLEHMRDNTMRKSRIRIITEIISAFPELELSFSRSLGVLKGQLTEALRLRRACDTASIAETLGETLIRTMARVLRDWSLSDSMTPDDAARRIIDQLTTLGKSLCPTGDPISGTRGTGAAR